MKKLYVSMLAIAGLFFLTVAMSTVEKMNVFGSQCDPLPNLPPIPYNYDISFPQYALFSDWNSIDSTAINAKITSKGATLGRVLFYDKKLSASNSLACASCHKQELAFADNKQFSDGINGAITARNSPNLNDIIWAGDLFFDNPNPLNGNLMLFWDCRESNLEHMVLQPIEHEGELGKDMQFLLAKLTNTEYYPSLFEDAFGDTQITPERIGDAIAQFVSSMSNFDSKFDRVQTGHATYSSQEEAGMQLFNESCGSFCHSAPHFGSLMPMNNGLDLVYSDQGIATWTNNTFDEGKFKSPSLRNIALTAPYMHDGRFETLEEVVDFYSEEVQQHPNNDFGWTGGGTDFTGFDFTNSEKAALVAFLKTLTDETFITAAKWSDPFAIVNSDHSLPLEEKINVFPNPFSESATIQLDNPGGELYKMQLTTLEGRVLKSFETRSNSVELKKADFAAGVYFLEIRKGDRKRVEKVVIN